MRASERFGTPSSAAGTRVGNRKLDAPVGAIDDAVRKYYETEGWGPGYHLPGLSHRPDMALDWMT